MDTKKIVIAVLALALVGFAVLQFTGNGQKESIADSTSQENMTVDGGATTNQNSDTVMVDESANANAEYKNGEYTAVGEYTAPSGQEKIGVTITLEDGIISDAELEKMAIHDVSKKMQNGFEAEYKAMVIGKDIDDVKLDVVGVSSLTPKGFNEALEQIKAQAKS